MTFSISGLHLLIRLVQPRFIDAEKEKDPVVGDREFETDGKNYLVLSVAPMDIFSVKEIQLEGKKKMMIDEFLLVERIRITQNVRMLNAAFMRFALPLNYIHSLPAQCRIYFLRSVKFLHSDHKFLFRLHFHNSLKPMLVLNNNQHRLF